MSYVKICGFHGKLTEEECYYIYHKAKGKSYYKCKKCVYRVNSEYAKRHPEKKREQALNFYYKDHENNKKIKRGWAKKYRKENSEIYYEKQRDYYKRTIEQQRLNKRKHRYGISPEIFRNLVEKQEGKCSICNKYEGMALCVDHCHNTGKIRKGLLCKMCNSGLGKLQDDIELLKKGIKHLKIFLK